MFLLDNFAAIAEAPGGFSACEELVLDLAVRGRLLEQDPGEGRAVAKLWRLLIAKREAVKRKGWNRRSPACDRGCREALRLSSHVVLGPT